MGQHFASLKKLIRMDSDKQSLEKKYPETIQRSLYDMLDQHESNLTNVENNGNITVVNTNKVLLNQEQETISDDKQLNLDIDNHNSRFESLYNQPVDGQESKQNSNNGNFIVTEQETFGQQEASCSNFEGSNTSSSSDDNTVNPVFRRSSKTLSFGRRKGMTVIFF